MNENDFGMPPPVPPRRRRHKKENAVKPGAQAPNSGSMCGRKPRLPPPPPPPQASRRSRPPPAGNCRSHSITSDKLHSNNTGTGSDMYSNSPVSLDEERVAATNPPSLPSPFRYIVEATTKESSDDSEEHQQIFGRDHGIRSKSGNNYCTSTPFRTFERKPRLNEYPPLFFTLQDFQDVMADSESNDRIKKSMSSFGTEIPQAKLNLETFPNERDDFDNSEIQFRVTNTNMPFEKWPGETCDLFESDSFTSKMNDTDHFIFEDYIDRRKKPIEQKPALFLFGDDSFEINAADSMSATHSATKVRFVVESPSSSTPDERIDQESIFDSLQNIDSLPADIVEYESSNGLQTDEAKTNTFSGSDEFGDIPFGSYLNNGVESSHPAYGNMNVNLVSLDIDYSEDSACDVLPNNSLLPQKDFQTFTVAASIETIPSTAILSDVILISGEQEASIVKEISFVLAENTADTLKKASFFPQPLIAEIHNENILHSLKTCMEKPHESSIEDVSSKVDGTDLCLEPEINFDILEHKYPRDNTKDLDEESQVDEETQTGINHGVPGGRERRDKGLCLPLKITKVAPDKSNAEENSRRKIFIDKSLCEFINDDDVDWNESFEAETDSDKMNGFSKSLGENTIKSYTKEDSDRFGNECQDVLKTQVKPDKQVSIRKEIPEVKDLNPHIFENTDDLFSESNVTPFSSSNVPVEIRRNSFLENMLRDNQVEDWVKYAPCKIVAIHPKTPVRKCSAHEALTMVNEGETPLVYPEADSQNHETKAVATSLLNETNQMKLKNTGFAPRGSKKNIPDPRNKSGGDAKSTVLSELLCNFSSIKLKPVNNTQGKDRCSGHIEIGSTKTMVDRGTTNNVNESEDDSKNPAMNRNVDSLLGDNAELNVSREPIGSKTTSVNKSQDGAAVCSKKTDEPIDKYVENSVCAKQVEPNENGIEVGLKGSIDDKCAIVRRSPRTRCNNNDNNTMTPVAVSSDQSRDVIPITPGSVRSFVKYYEIQRETSKNSKSKDSVLVGKKIVGTDARPPGTTLCEPVVAGVIGNTSEEMIRGMKRNEIDISHCEVIDSSNDIKYTFVTRKFVQREANPLPNEYANVNQPVDVPDESTEPVPGERESDESYIKAAKVCGNESKKIVQFRTGCTVIQARVFDQDETSINSICGAKSKIKRKAPGRPKPEMRDQEHVLRSTAPPPMARVERNTMLQGDGSQLEDQGDSGVYDKHCTTKSGTKSGTATPHLSQPCVFYCTV